MKSARTVIGHDMHLQLPADLKQRQPEAPQGTRPQVSAQAANAAPTVVVRDEPTEPRPDRRARPKGKSRLARFLGRWTDGQFRSNAQWDRTGRMKSGIDDDLRVPRDNAGRNVLLVLSVALLTFLVTYAIVRLRQHLATSELPVEQMTLPQPAPIPPSPRAPTVAPPVAAPAPPSSVVAPPPVAPAPSLVPSGAGAESALSVHTTTAAKPKPVPTNPRGGAKRSRFTVEPPDHLKDELLPFSP